MKVDLSFGWSWALGVAFVVLRLLEKIDWPWVWVLAPFWAPFVLVVAIFCLIGLLVLLGARR